MRMFVTGLVALAIATPAIANDKVKVGDKAPEFSGIPATYKGEDTSISLSDIEEEVVVLVFLGNHCPYVVAIEDHLNDFCDSFEGKSVKLVGVSVNDHPQDKLPQIKEWVKEKNSLYTYGYDESQEIGRNYGSTKTPEFFVLDKDRTIAYMGAMYKNPLKVEPGETNFVADAVNSLLAGESIEVKQTPAIGCGVVYKKK